MTDSLYQLSAIELVQKLKSGQVTIRDCLESVQKRINQTDDAINALPTLCFDRAIDQADKIQALPVEQRGLLAGLPVTIKDLTPVANVRTTFGSRTYENFIPQQSDRLVQRLEQQGAVIYAKSNTPEFGTGGITFNDVFGVTRTPRNIKYASGGSSGGAAASLAAGSAWLSHGSDMAGSLRTPAAFCGVCSLRPSPGKIVADSDYMPFDILGEEGPMARNIKDLGLFADAMMNDHVESMLDAARSPLKPVKVAISNDLGIANVSDDVLNGFSQLIDNLVSNNVIIEIQAPDLSGVHDVFDVLRAQAYAVSMEQILFDNPSVLKPEVEWNIKSGLSLSSDKIRHAIRNQGQIINRAFNFMKNYDLLICPATSVLSVEAELRYPGSDDVPIPEYYRWLAIAYATTVTCLPIITLPCGLGKNGMPIGVQLIGKPGGEALLFRHAAAIEAMINWSSLPIDPVDLSDSSRLI
jgi:amidase